MKKNNISGIYCIENLINGKKYIGQSSNLYRRKSKHFIFLNKGTHLNSHLQRSFNKYGKENFVFKILLYCEPFELTRYEQFFVNIISSKKLYNICLECVTSVLGTKMSRKTKRKISKANKNPSLETRLKMSNAQKGKHISEEHKRKMSIENTGKNHPQYGKHRSEETKRKISESKTGRPSGLKGIPRSEDIKKRICEAQTKLTKKETIEIIKKLIDGQSNVSLAAEYDVSPDIICLIKLNKTWKHIMPEVRNKLIKTNKRKIKNETK